MEQIIKLAWNKEDTWRKITTEKVKQMQDIMAKIGYKEKESVIKTAMERVQYQKQMDEISRVNKVIDQKMQEEKYKVRGVYIKNRHKESHG